MASDGEHIFISYARADGLEFATKLKKDLENVGQTVWMDLEGIEPGAPFDVRIEKAICSASEVLAIMTPSSFRDNSVCRDEVAFAHSENKHIVPIRIFSNLKPSLLLSRLNWIDFTSSYNTGFTSTVKFLEGDQTVLKITSLPETGGIKPLDFSLEIARNITGLTGRKWVGGLIDDWLINTPVKAFIFKGEPGIGKSTIAAWLSQQRSDQVLAIHFCSNEYSRTLSPFEFVASLVGQISMQIDGYKELVQMYGLEESRLKAKDAFRELIVEPLRQLPEPDKTSVIIIDSLDEAMLQEGETILDVLDAQSENLPSWVRVIATTRFEAKVLDRIKRFHIFELEDRSNENCSDLSSYIKKRLEDPILVNKVGSKSKEVRKSLEELSEGNFLYAKIALDSLAGSTLTVKDLGDMPPGLSYFFTKIFNEIFVDIEEYSNDYASLFKVLSIAYEPLPFKLLCQLLDLDPEILHRRLRIMQPFLEESVIEEDSAHSLFHRSLQEWLISRKEAGDYWVDPESSLTLLVDFLKKHYLDFEYAIRFLPKHLMFLSRWQDIYDLMSDLNFFGKAWNANEYEVKYYWAKIEANSDMNMVKAYRNIIDNPAQYEEYTWKIAKLLFDTGFLDESMSLWDYTSKRHRESGDQANLAASIKKQADLLYTRGDLEEAMGLYKEQENIFRELGNRDGLQASLGNQALILKAKGDLGGAMKLHKESEKIFRELGNRDGLQASLGNQAGILFTQGNLMEAMKFYKEAEDICRELGNRDGLSKSLGGQALILSIQGDLDGAMKLHKEEENICRELGNRDGLQASLGNQALILRNQGNLAGANELLKEQENICRELGNQKGLSISIANQADLLRKLGKLDDALTLSEKAYEIANSAGLVTIAEQILIEQLTL